MRAFFAVQMSDDVILGQSSAELDNQGPKVSPFVGHLLDDDLAGAAQAVLQSGLHGRGAAVARHGNIEIERARHALQPRDELIEHILVKQVQVDRDVRIFLERRRRLLTLRTDIIRNDLDRPLVHRLPNHGGQDGTTRRVDLATQFGLQASQALAAQNLNDLGQHDTRAALALHPVPESVGAIKGRPATLRCVSQGGGEPPTRTLAQGGDFGPGAE